MSPHDLWGNIVNNDVLITQRTPPQIIITWWPVHGCLVYSGLIDNGDGTDASLMSPVVMNSPRALKESFWIKHGGVVKVLYFNTLQDKSSGGLMNMVPVIHLDQWLVGFPGWIQLQSSRGSESKPRSGTRDTATCPCKLTVSKAMLIPVGLYITCALLIRSPGNLNPEYKVLQKLPILQMCHL